MLMKPILLHLQTNVIKCAAFPTLQSKVFFIYTMYYSISLSLVISSLEVEIDAITKSYNKQQLLLHVNKKLLLLFITNSSDWLGLRNEYFCSTLTD